MIPVLKTLGDGEVVRCYQCNGSVHGWKKNDCPWQQHAIHAPHCPHLALKKDHRYIFMTYKAHSVHKRESETFLTVHVVFMKMSYCRTTYFSLRLSWGSKLLPEIVLTRCQVRQLKPNHAMMQHRGNIRLSGGLWDALYPWRILNPNGAVSSNT